MKGAHPASQELLEVLVGGRSWKQGPSSALSYKESDSWLFSSLAAGVWVGGATPASILHSHHAYVRAAILEVQGSEA